MASRGRAETDRLKDQISEQLDRLMTQLKDVEELKDDLEPDEYEETKKETIDQLKEFQESLKKMDTGDMTLVTDIGAVQLAIQATISNAFKTPEVIKMFAKKQPGQLRSRLTELQRDVKLGKVPEEQFKRESVEILTALKKLGDALSAEDQAFLSAHAEAALKDFESATESIGGQGILSVAEAEISKAQS